MKKESRLRLSGAIPGHRPLLYVTTTYTRQLFVEELAMNPELEACVDAVTERLSAAGGHIAAELFARVYDSRATRPVDAPNASTAWLSAWHADLDTSPEFRGFQRRYNHDPEGAGLATQYLLDGIVAELGRAKRPPRVHAYDPDSVERGERGQRGQAGTPDDDDPAVGGSGYSEDWDGDTYVPNLSDDPAEQAAAVERALAQAAQQDDLTEFIQSRGVQRAGRAALKKAREELGGFRDASVGLGLVDQNGGLPQGVNTKTRALLAKRLRSNPRLRQIAAAAGRFRVLARDKQRAEAGPGAGEITELEFGNSITRVVPAELVGLCMPEMADLFAKRFLDRGLTQYRVHAPVPKGRGPIIFCIDISGSMAPTSDSDPDLWAKAIFAGVAEIALRQKRFCHAILFTERISLEVALDPKVPEPGKFEKVFSLTPHGGTRFDVPLKRCLVLLKEAQKTALKPLKKADIVFLTDGDGNVPHDIILELEELKKQIGLHVAGILIGNSSPETLATFADTVTSISDFADAAAGTQLAQGLYSSLTGNK